jgi:hypothetical protein
VEQIPVALRDRGVESFEMKRLQDCPSFACNFDLVTCIDALDRSPFSEALQAVRARFRNDEMLSTKVLGKFEAEGVVRKNALLQLFLSTIRS